MSVLIKGMEMPKNGCHHIITIYSDGTVATGKANNYEAIEVPTPHGDLIDAEKQMRLMQSYDYDTYDDYCRAFDMLDNAPTVILAERSKE